VTRRLVIVALFLSLFGLGWWAGRSSARGDLYANLDLFVEVLHRVQDAYVDPVDPAKLVDGAVKGMLRGLDPYSQYLDTRAYGQLQSVTQGSFGGIGIVVGVRDNYPTVISPIEGTPAWRAGLRSGDVIVKIEGKSSSGLSIEEVADRLRGAEGTSVRLSVHREGEEGGEGDQDYTIERQVIVTRAVPYEFMADKTVGYIRLANFSEKSGEEVRSAMDELRRRGARALILDLRLNPGGLLDQAVDVAEQFLPRNALVVYTHGRARGQDNRFHANEANPQLQWPVVALVDNGTASAAEIVAGALQDLDRALVMGRTSFGKGSVQSVFPLRGRNAALKLTTALYYTPSGRSIHHLVKDSTQTDEDDDTPAPTDSVKSKPVYHTASGRIVYGGGGITPDVTVLQDSLPLLAQQVEVRGLTFRFANRWLNTHPEAPAQADEVPWSQFVAFMRSEKLSFTDAELNAQRPLLERSLRRELARRTGGDAAAVKIALEADPVYLRALDVLHRAKAPRDVFALAGAGQGPARATVGTH
jgi:carboxyl-terminal processing protease